MQQSHELVRITRAPAPLFVDGPQRHVSKHDDGCAGGAALQVLFDPGQLLLAQRAEPARLELQHIDQSNEMYASVIEAVVALVVGSFPEAVEILRNLLIRGVMFAWNRVQLGRPEPAEQLLRGIKLCG